MKNWCFLLLLTFFACSHNTPSENLPEAAATPAATPTAGPSVTYSAVVSVLPETITTKTVGKLPTFIGEASGLAHLGGDRLAWVNDSGNKAEVYVTNIKGEHKGTYFLTKKDGKAETNVDFEALAVFEGKLYVADTGDDAREKRVLSYSLSLPFGKVVPDVTVLSGMPYDSEGFTVASVNGVERWFFTSKEYEPEGSFKNQALFECSPSTKKCFEKFKLPGVKQEVGALASFGDIFAYSESKKSEGGKAAVVFFKFDLSFKRHMVPDLGQNETLEFLDANTLLYSTEYDGGAPINEIDVLQSIPGPAPTPTPAPSPAPAGAYKKPPYPISDWQILHFEKLADLKKNARRSPMVTVELNDNLKPGNGPEICEYLHSIGAYCVGYTSTTVAPSYHLDIKKCVLVGTKKECVLTYPVAAYGEVLKDFQKELQANIHSHYGEVAAFIKGRFRKLKELGYDAVELDNIDMHQNAKTYGVTIAENVKFIKEMIAYAHSIGLAYVYKNGIILSEHGAHLEADAMINESCVAESDSKYDECKRALVPWKNRSVPKLLMFYNGQCYWDWKTYGAFCSKDSKSEGYFVDKSALLLLKSLQFPHTGELVLVK